MLNECSATVWYWWIRRDLKKNHYNQLICYTYLSTKSWFWYILFEIFQLVFVHLHNYKPQKLFLIFIETLSMLVQKTGKMLPRLLQRKVLLQRNSRHKFQTSMMLVSSSQNHGYWWLLLHAENEFSVIETSNEKNFVVKCKSFIAILDIIALTLKSQ